MYTGNVTTPFGRRPMTYGMLADQLAAQAIDENACVDKWKLYRWLCEARPRLNISDRALSLLNALLSFYPKSELRGGDSLIVFPSNAQLSLRAHGMAEATIRRHIAALVEVGLLIRRDSANGKRFARRDSEGDIGQAFGFSLAPLLQRAAEFEALAAAVVAERLQYQALKERLTICRRDIVKLLQAAIDEDGGDEDENIAQMRDLYRDVMSSLPRHPEAAELDAILIVLDALRENLAKFMTERQNSPNYSGNHDHSERHKQNSNTQPQYELEPSFEKKQERNPVAANSPKVQLDEPMDGQPGTMRAAMRQPVSYPDSGPSAEAMMKPFPLAMVLSACPEICDYGPGGAISSWREFLGAAVVVRSMLGVSPSAFEEACAVMGPENAATAIACILERAGHINSAGGYLRDLTRRAERGEFSLGPMLMAQLRANGEIGVKRA
ncbi:plasmid replication protein RepC [Rhizobium sp. C4]|uniref:plasmid replication protein RepC n=1 Tax=Rhizobium sp. C4 TaxID=1349800 RepID=UPI001E285AED|nr:plasmid replication protein RepC [Rhizobium sp. C4]MCD2173567.1 replication initiation protein RepC [Rhizobium sp. C4]